MANFVEFVYRKLRYHINMDQIIAFAEPALVEEGEEKSEEKGKWSIGLLTTRFQHSLEYAYETKEEAQALYDLLRGKKENLSKCCNKPLAYVLTGGSVGAFKQEIVQKQFNCTECSNYEYTYETKDLKKDQNIFKEKEPEKIKFVPMAQLRPSGYEDKVLEGMRDLFKEKEEEIPETKDSAFKTEKTENIEMIPGMRCGFCETPLNNMGVYKRVKQKEENYLQVRKEFHLSLLEKLDKIREVFEKGGLYEEGSTAFWDPVGDYFEKIKSILETPYWKLHTGGEIKNKFTGKNHVPITVVCHDYSDVIKPYKNKLDKIREIAEHIFGFNAGIYNGTGKYKGHNYGGINNSITTNAYDNFQLAHDILDILNDTETHHEDVNKSVTEEKMKEKSPLEKYFELEKESEIDTTPVRMTRGQFNYVKEKLQSPLNLKLAMISRIVENCINFKGCKDEKIAYYISSINSIKLILEDK